MVGDAKHGNALLSSLWNLSSYLASYKHLAYIVIACLSAIFICFLAARLRFANRIWKLTVRLIALLIICNFAGGGAHAKLEWPEADCTLPHIYRKVSDSTTLSQSKFAYKRVDSGHFYHSLSCFKIFNLKHLALDSLPLTLKMFKVPLPAFLSNPTEDLELCLLERALNNPKWIEKAEECLSNLKKKKVRFETNHLAVNLEVVFCKMTSVSARFCHAYLGITVEKHFALKHGTILHFDFPCLVVKGGGKHLSFFPLEVINVVTSFDCFQSEAYKMFRCMKKAGIQLGILGKKLPPPPKELAEVSWRKPRNGNQRPPPNYYGNNLAGNTKPEKAGENSKEIAKRQYKGLPSFSGGNAKTNVKVNGPPEKIPEKEPKKCVYLLYKEHMQAMNKQKCLTCMNKHHACEEAKREAPSPSWSIVTKGASSLLLLCFAGLLITPAWASDLHIKGSAESSMDSYVHCPFPDDDFGRLDSRRRFASLPNARLSQNIFKVNIH